MLLHDAHPGYITWERFEENERQLRDNAQSYGAQRRGPPREGPALLQGLAICGVCGRNMGVRYHTRKGEKYPDYTCGDRARYETADTGCQNISGAAIDRAVGELLVELMTPLTLDLALQVQDELAARAGEADLWRAQRVQRAREEAKPGAAEVHAGPSRQPDGRRCAGGGVEREAPSSGRGTARA